VKTKKAATEVNSAAIAVDYSDCGDASTHAKVTDLQPRAIFQERRPL